MSLFLKPLFRAKPLPKPAAQQLLEITKPWVCLDEFKDGNPGANLPEHYKHFYWQWKYCPKQPVHYIPEQGNFKLAEDGENVVEVKQKEVQLVFPDGVDKGLWGGEGVIKGYYHIGRYKGEMSKYWWPTLVDSVLYSEILDKYIEIPTTNRALKLIDKHYGLDYYILKTPYQDLNSLLGFKLKREMLLALATGNLYPNDSETKKAVLEKYKEFIVPAEEADWIGLSLEEALTKLQKQEASVPPEPFRHQFRQQLLEYLKENPPTEHSQSSPASKSPSILERLNPFGRRT